MSRHHEDIRELARLIEEVSGIVVPEGYDPFLYETVRQRLHARGLPDAASYVRALARGALREEWSALLSMVTVKESYCFRTPQHFEAIHRTVVPALTRARAARRRLRVWSAGCARGEEPATLAIVLAGIEDLAGWDWRIAATDVDDEALAAGTSGIYGERAVSRVPAALRQRYFTPENGGFRLDDVLLRRIDYHPLNLIREPFPFPSEPYDLILMRNVLIYFRHSSQRRVVANIARCLAPDGWLFLGPSETLWQISTDLEPVDLADCFAYRHRGHGGAAPARRPAASRSRPQQPPPAPSPAAPRHPSPAIPPPSRPSEPREVPAPPASPQRETWGTGDRLAAAAARIAANDLASASSLISEAIDADPADPAVRAVEGLVRDLSGETGQAVASYRAALFLEPSLFQVRLLLADALRRLGWTDRARHEYREVLAAVAAGRTRLLSVSDVLALPGAEEARFRCRQALQAG